MVETEVIKTAVKVAPEFKQAGFVPYGKANECTTHNLADYLYRADSFKEKGDSLEFHIPRDADGNSASVYSVDKGLLNAARETGEWNGTFSHGRVVVPEHLYKDAEPKHCLYTQNNTLKPFG